MVVSAEVWMKWLVLVMVFGVLVEDQVARACVPGEDGFIVRDTNLCISNHGDSVSVTRGRVRAPLPLPLKPGFVYQPMAVRNVGRKGDLVTVLVEQSCGSNFRVKFTVAQLEARIANAEGLVHHRDGRYAEAADAFAKASALDPDAATFATNLACALALGGKHHEAVVVMTKLAATQRPWVLWKLVSDPELASLHTHAEIAALLTARGTFTLADLDKVGVGIVPNTWAVHRHWVGSHGNEVATVDVVRVVDLVTGDVRFEMSADDRGAIDRFLAVMGFSAEGVSRKSWQGEFDVAWSAQFPGGKARSLRESSSLHECPDYGDVVIRPVR
jgi:hypothetical protein